MADKKYVYFFGDGKAEGRGDMKDLLGGKGANLADMTSIGLPVPPGFTITTEACDFFDKHNGTYPNGMRDEVLINLKKLEDLMGAKLGDKERDIIEKRYGFNGNEPMSLKAIGDEYNLTKERIRQIEKAALQKLRNNGESVGLEYYSEAI